MKEPINPIIQMLSWKTRLLDYDDIISILAAIAKIDKQPFTLTDLGELLPKDIVENSKKRRSISTLLTNLVRIGYLSKPSERKWSKNATSLSHYLSTMIIELGNLERRELPKSIEKRIVKIGSD